VSTKRIQFKRVLQRSLLVGLVLVLGYTVTLINAGPQIQKASDITVTPETEQQTVSASPASLAPTTRVTVNGKEVPVVSGHVHHSTVADGGSITTVDVSDNKPAAKPSNGSAANQENLSISVNSSSHGGSGTSTAQVFGTSFSNNFNGSSSGFSNTHVFSTGSVNTFVSP
jgi:hypothetical protein